MHRYAGSMKGLTDGDTSAGDLVIYLGLGGNSHQVQTGYLNSRAHLPTVGADLSFEQKITVSKKKVLDTCIEEDCTMYIHLDGMGLCLIQAFFTQTHNGS